MNRIGEKEGDNVKIYTIEFGGKGGERVTVKGLAYRRKI